MSYAVIDTERQSITGRDPIQIYLKEIVGVPLLTPQEEIKLARRMRRGDKSARLQMIQANLRLVVKIAHDYAGLGLPLLDLINEGNIGLMTAVERFDPKKGAKLSTYASWWIKQCMRRALANQSKTIRLPVHVVDKVSRMHRLSHQMTEMFGREPTDIELADRLDIPAYKVAQLRTLGVRPSSLESPVGGEDDENGARFGDIIEDPSAMTPYELVRTRNQSQDVQQQLQYLSPREARIIRLRFGLDGQEPKTLEEVGAKFHVSRERIRQIQDVALAKLRRRFIKLDAPRREPRA